MQLYSNVSSSYEYTVFQRTEVPIIRTKKEAPIFLKYDGVIWNSKICLSDIFVESRGHDDNYCYIFMFRSFIRYSTYTSAFLFFMLLWGKIRADIKPPFSKSGAPIVWKRCSSMDSKILRYGVIHSDLCTDTIRIYWILGSSCIVSLYRCCTCLTCYISVWQSIEDNI